jgi:copper transport protein
MSWNQARRLLLMAGAAAALVLVTASAAGARTGLAGSEPADGGRLAPGRDAIVLRFTGAVDPSLVTVELSAGRVRAEAGPGYEVGGDRRAVEVPLPALSAGTWTASWRAVATDGRTLGGRLRFTVPTPEPAAAAGGRVAAAKRPATLVGAVLVGGQLVALAGLLVLVGGLGLVAAAGVPGRLAAATLPAGRPPWRLDHLLGAAWVLALTGCVAVLLLHGPATGLDLGSRAGRVWAGRVLLLVLAAPLVLLPTGQSWSLPRRAGAVALVGLVALTAGFSGHAGTGDDLIASMIADAHFGSVAIWLASLLALGAAVWPGQGAGLRRAVPRLTEIEAKAMGVIVVSGGLRLLAHLDDPRAMLGTGWGRLLLVKLAVLALLLGVGAATRRWAGERLGPVGDGSPPDRQLAGLRRLVAVEVLLAGLILALSAALANLSPVLPPVSG